MASWSGIIMNMLGTVLGCLRDGVYSAVCYGKRSQGVNRMEL